MHDVAVVILNWNGAHLLEQYLPSVIQFSGDARIVVADNASTDNSIRILKEHFPEVDIIRNEENGGFAKGYNDALEKIGSKYYVLLNSDVKVTENWLTPLLSVMQETGVAACQPKIKSLRNPDSFEHAGASGGFLDKNYFPFCRGRIFSKVEADTGQYDHAREVFWASGAAMMIEAEVYHEVGGMDEDFFAHMEEIDMCWRIKQLGYRIMVEPLSVVYHLGGATLEYTSPRKIYLNFRNSLEMIVKNHEGSLFPKMFNRLCHDGLAGTMFLLKAQFGQFWAVFRAHMYMYRNIRKMLKKRRALQLKRTKMNYVGIYRGNIVWNAYIKRVKKFSDLNQRLFR